MSSPAIKITGIKRFLNDTLDSSGDLIPRCIWCTHIEDRAVGSEKLANRGRQRRTRYCAGSCSLPLLRPPAHLEATALVFPARSSGPHVCQVSRFCKIRLKLAEHKRGRNIPVLCHLNESFLCKFHDRVHLFLGTLKVLDCKCIHGHATYP